MYSRILESKSKYSILVSNIVDSLPAKFHDYHWLVTGFSYSMQNKKYLWLTINELVDMSMKKNFENWCVISGFDNTKRLEDVLDFELPYADGQTSFWKDKVDIQHRLAEIEIVSWDGCSIIVIVKDKKLIDEFDQTYEEFDDLEFMNRQRNLHIKHIEKLLIEVSNEYKNLDSSQVLKLKHHVYQNTYKDCMVPLSEQSIKEEIVFILQNKGLIKGPC